MADEYADTSAFRAASFTNADLAGARFTRTNLTGVQIRDSDLTGMKVADSWLVDLDISGEVRNLRVNDVDVTAYVEGELDRRHPERLQLQAVRTADDHRAMWDTLERLWADTVARAELLPEPVRRERVNGEWSFVETLRHLVFATDAWVSRTVLDERAPFHPLGLTQAGYPVEVASEIGLDLAAEPSWDEVLRARCERMAVVRRVVDSLTEADLERVCERAPAPTYPEEPRSVRRCLRVVMIEECEHRRYAVRDLAVLEAR